MALFYYARFGVTISRFEIKWSERFSDVNEHAAGAYLNLFHLSMLMIQIQANTNKENEQLQPHSFHSLTLSLISGLCPDLKYFVRANAIIIDHFALSQG